jgi:hypothetical protein
VQRVRLKTAGSEAEGASLTCVSVQGVLRKFEGEKALELTLRTGVDVLNASVWARVRERRGGGQEGEGTRSRAERGMVEYGLGLLALIPSCACKSVGQRGG